MKLSSEEINALVLCLYYLNFSCVPHNGDVNFGFSNTLLNILVT